jgi:hypothetical protein
MSLKEKLQITLPGKEEQGEQWASFESQRYTDHNPSPDSGQRFNKMPESAIDDGCTHYMPLSLAGRTDVTDQLSDSALVRGFTPAPMKGTDDQYTGEHCDLFYGDSGGFAERNNYMDRL